VPRVALAITMWGLAGNLDPDIMMTGLSRCGMCVSTCMHKALLWLFAWSIDAVIDVRRASADLTSGASDTAPTLSRHQQRSSFQLKLQNEAASRMKLPAE